MGFRFRRSIRLAKGLRINLSKSGAGLSVGHRGATVNFGPKGERVTAGLPGTGLSYSKTIGPGTSERRSHDFANENTPAPIPPDQSSRKAVLLPWLAVLAILLLIIAAVIAPSN